ncbi:MAG TPA: mannose-1-phosphate guanylyltransferase/mannose-6-phosphate isomerase [Burkholderiales bacterium]|nr:mannose-1-phosphate guanylyltransferase/mannose-6-phosphate isomerase [Burkholderiales bacterium]
MTTAIQPIVLAGGSGTRLWPVSRKLMPKQFLRLVSDRSMLQETISRTSAHQAALPPIILCSEDHRFLVAEQLREAGVSGHTMILEPAGRGTAAAAALGALAVRDKNPDAVLALLSADHAIGNGAAYLSALDRGARLAADGNLVVFGIAPAGPSTEYGYIVRGKPLGDAFRVEAFFEKPDALRAAQLLSGGNAYWNSGIFLFTAQTLLAELEKFRPDILRAVEQAWANRRQDLEFIRLGREQFLACPAEAIDRAVMEQTRRAAVVPADFEWSDVGSWEALWKVGKKDGLGNVTRGDAHLQDTRDSYVWSGSRLVCTLGVKGLLVVETDDAVIVGDRSRAQDVKSIVDWLAAEKRTEHVSHRRVYRPWGYYETLDAGDRFQVKGLMVKPGEALSLQMHHHRAEHWVVVSGTAKVTRGEETMTISENESTFIPLGTKHRLENPGKIPLYLIEVQSGSYLSEDDIVRFEDRYQRGNPGG